MSLTSVLCIVILVLTPVIAFTADETDHGSSDHSNGGLLEAMGLNPKLIITQVAGFLIVLFVLNKLVFGKVGGILADRQSEIVSRMNKLETDQAELDRLTAETTQRLNQIEAEAQQKIRTAIDQGNEERQQILETARQDAANQVDQARAEIQREKEEAILELRGIVSEIAIDAASKIIDQQLDVESHRHIVDEYIGQLS
ncbi:MAG: F0F1 ATP synthase subunit B, partial [Candidatus Poribacteria bacterium]|nr:F0F1 ATP synthase subunit B [Candidatus Poribacteria bacterium]